MNSRWFAAAALGLVLAGPALADAQAGPPDAPAADPTGADGMASHAGQAHGLKALHDILGVTPAQEAAFQAFAAARRSNREALRAQHADLAAERAKLESMTTPERLDLMAQDMTARQAEQRARFTRIAEATKAFYAQLTPEQKRIMDALPDLRDGPGHHGPRGMAPGWGDGPRNGGSPQSPGAPGGDPTAE
ncbi:MAG: Spy/CpxP family protein refolding chaperone [Alphaproteobacteria bacterium]|nr:Spy/CpxP family protein refolding chaperone [Alphaproteobacteria bacterium]